MISETESMDQKRTYIRRKRCLSEIVSTIKNTLVYMFERSGTEISEEAINSIAEKHSNAIEAACWFPKQHMTECEYANLLMMKAKQLCSALLSQKFQNGAGCPPLSPVCVSSDPEIIEKKHIQPQIPLMNPDSGMSADEICAFLKSGMFSFAHCAPNTLPPLVKKDK